MSNDASVVAFRRVVGDVDDDWSHAVVEVWDKASGTTIQISPEVPNEYGGFHYAGTPQMTPDGRFVNFGIAGKSLVYDRIKKTFIAEMPGAWSMISSDGRFVAFTSSSSELVPDDTNGRADLFVRDLWNGRTFRANLEPGGAQSEDEVQVPGGYTIPVRPPEALGVGLDGRVTFVADALDLVTPAESSWDDDVYVRSFDPAAFAPETEISGGPTGLVKQQVATFTFASWAASFECSLDSGAWQPCTSPLTTPALGDGKHSLAVRALHDDVADPTPATRTWTVDTVAPKVSITAGPATASSDRTPTFAFKATESGVRYSCKVDGGSWTSCTSPRTTGTLASGSHTFWARATDAAGNTGPSSTGWKFVIDYTRPDTRITSGPGITTTDSTPTLRFASSETGSTFQCRVDRGEWRSCRSGWTTKRLSKGKHVLAVRAIDKARNVDATPAARTTTVR
jgi:hypothetical protein